MIEDRNYMKIEEDAFDQSSYLQIDLKDKETPIQFDFTIYNDRIAKASLLKKRRFNVGEIKEMTSLNDKEFYKF